jgi:Polyketide cyclase / dehydrase and lipid transport
MSPNKKPWVFEHSVECAVDPDFAWNFWTDVDNWALDADVESLKIDGPFAPGAQGVTYSRSSGEIHWRIAEVQTRRAVIEFPLAGAVGRFIWTFEELDGRTRITQHCTLEGDQADVYAEAIAPSLEIGIPAGMQKLADAMEHASGAK